MPFGHGLGQAPGRPDEESTGSNLPKYDPLEELRKMAALRTTVETEDDAIARWKREKGLAKAINDGIREADALIRLESQLDLLAKQGVRDKAKPKSTEEREF